ncbi:D-alanine--D-alanine ligase A [Candidatus Saccharibacteria bacterium]|nr:MAG: D-alanine--D-alanine ligase A [Candidatus Saccharibacteria bacterium]
MQQKRVLLVFGGESPEHSVSLASAKSVFEAINKDRFVVDLCYIDQDGVWWNVDHIGASGEEMQRENKLVPILGSACFVRVPDGKTVRPDVILPVLHGANGEDGSVQGLAQLLHMPIVGPSLLAAAITMDKDVTKRLLRLAAIDVIDWVTWHTFNERPTFAEMQNRLGSVLFVKPATAGSSIGVNKVRNEQEFDAALNAAAEHSSKVIIESAINARELGVAVLGNDRPVTTHAGEITPEAEFYSYDAKYAETSQAKVTIPAEISEAEDKRLQQLAIDTYRMLECRGLARVDFFLTDDGRIIVNEVNTLPEFTNISMYSKLWQNAGIGYGALISRLIDLAFQQYNGVEKEES